MILRILPFLVLATVIFTGLHFFIYFSTVKFFSISNPNIKNILVILTIILLSSFVISSIVSRFWENIFTNYFYIISSVWIGFFVNLTLASFAMWIIIGITKITHFNFDTFVFSSIFFALAFIFSAQGIWNTFHPVIKNVEVQIRDLPKQWKDKTVVQISDAHIGKIYGVEFLKKIVDMSNSLNPDAVFITGDLFDGMDGDLNRFAETLNSIRAKNGVYFVTGNHEGYVGLENALSVLRKTKIKILNNEVASADGLQVIGVSYNALNEQKGLEATIRANGNFSKYMPTIMLNHIPNNINTAKNLGVNLQLSGHTHTGQMLPFNLITMFMYEKYYYGLNTEEDFSIYTSNGVGTWGPPMRTNGSPEIVAIKLK